MTYVAEVTESCQSLSGAEAGVRFHFPAWQPKARRDLGSPSESPLPPRVSRSPDSYRLAGTNTIPAVLAVARLARCATLMLITLTNKRDNYSHKYLPVEI